MFCKINRLRILYLIAFVIGDVLLFHLAWSDIVRDILDTGRTDNSSERVNFPTPSPTAGINSVGRALISFNGQLVVSGDFTYAGTKRANHVATWNGDWQPLGTGFNNFPAAFAEYDGKLVAGGAFTATGSSLSTNGVAYWNGADWLPLGDGVGGAGTLDSWWGVHALTVYEGKLVAGGNFTMAGGREALFVAAWDGSSWSTLDSGLNAEVFALTVYDNKLIAGGAFTGPGYVGTPYTDSLRHIAAWNGSDWVPLGSGMFHFVYSLSEFDGNLIAGGAFPTAGGLLVHNIAQWDGSEWLNLSSGTGNSVVCLTTYNERLVAGGYFIQAGTIAGNGIASWDGNDWSAMGNDRPAIIWDVAVHSDYLFACGAFSRIGGIKVSNIAYWDGNVWQPLLDHSDTKQHTYCDDPNGDGESNLLDVVFALKQLYQFRLESSDSICLDFDNSGQFNILDITNFIARVFRLDIQNNREL